MTSVARLVGERLRAAGVRYVFGHPGGEVVDLIEGFRQAGLEFVLTRHETSAGFIAAAMATSTGVPSDVPRQEASDAARQPAPVDPEPALDPGSEREAAALLRASGRPLVIVGMDANEPRVVAPLRAFAEAWRLPVLDLPKAKGVFR